MNATTRDGTSKVLLILIAVGLVAMACDGTGQGNEAFLPESEIPLEIRRGLSLTLRRFGERPLREYVTPQVQEAARRITLMKNRIQVEGVIVHFDDRIEEWSLVYEDETCGSKHVEHTSIHRLETHSTLKDIVRDCAHRTPTESWINSSQVEGWVVQDIVETWVDGSYLVFYSPRVEKSPPTSVWECIRKNGGLAIETFGETGIDQRPRCDEAAPVEGE